MGNGASRSYSIVVPVCDEEKSLEELHRTQSKLVQTARLTAMGELAAAVAHQINNPLTTILGDAEMILQDLPPDNEDAEAMEAIFRAGKRAHEVVRRLLMMARQQTTDDAGRDDPGGDRQDHRHRMQSHRASHQERLQHMAFQLHHADEDGQHDHRGDPALGDQCDHHRHRSADQGTDDEDQ